jgi:hypothetical protein
LYSCCTWLWEVLHARDEETLLLQLNIVICAAGIGSEPPGTTSVVGEPIDEAELLP